MMDRATAEAITLRWEHEKHPGERPTIKTVFDLLGVTWEEWCEASSMEWVLADLLNGLGRVDWYAHGKNHRIDGEYLVREKT